MHSTPVTDFVPLNNTCLEPSFTAFAGTRRVATGGLAAVAQALGPWHGTVERLLVFDDRTGAPVDVPPPPSQPQALAAWLSALQPVAAVHQEDSVEPVADRRRGVGRPRLGVVAREITLLPRHWDWLATQPGGASAALRRLVDAARQTHAERDARRLARDRAYRFMSGIASHLPGFEDAARALFADDAAAFDGCVDSWAADVRAHLRWLARDAFDQARP